MRPLGCTGSDLQFCGAPEGIRTPNLLIRSQVLYPLSYGRVPSRRTTRGSVPEPRRRPSGRTGHAPHSPDLRVCLQSSGLRMRGTGPSRAFDLPHRRRRAGRAVSGRTASCVRCGVIQVSGSAGAAAPCLGHPVSLCWSPKAGRRPRHLDRAPGLGSGPGSVHRSPGQLPDTQPLPSGRAHASSPDRTSGAALSRPAEGRASRPSAPPAGPGRSAGPRAGPPRRRWRYSSRGRPPA